MTKREVQIGGRYVAKVSGGLTVVRLVRESVYGGWDAINESTGRAVRIKTAARLRRAVPEPGGMARSEKMASLNDFPREAGYR